MRRERLVSKKQRAGESGPWVHSSWDLWKQCLHGATYQYSTSTDITLKVPAPWDEGKQLVFVIGRYTKVGLGP